MDRPHIRRGGCAAPAGMGTLLLFLALLIGGCLPKIPPLPIPGPVNPVPASGFKVLIVEEAARRDKLLPEQVEIFTSAPFRMWLKDQSADVRIWDQAVDVENESDAGFKAMLQMPRTSLPWLIVSGKPGFSGPLPKSLQETEAVIAKSKP